MSAPENISEAVRAQPRSYTSEQILDLTGITYRQLDYWCRCGWLGDSLRWRGSGNFRTFTEAQAALIHVTARLIYAGFTASAAVRIAKEIDGLADYSPAASPPIRLTIVPGGKQATG